MFPSAEVPTLQASLHQMVAAALLLAAVAISHLYPVVVERLWVAVARLLKPIVRPGLVVAALLWAAAVLHLLQEVVVLRLVVAVLLWVVEILLWAAAVLQLAQEQRDVDPQLRGCPSMKVPEL